MLCVLRTIDTPLVKMLAGDLQLGKVTALYNTHYCSLDLFFRNITRAWQLSPSSPSPPQPQRGNERGTHTLMEWRRTRECMHGLKCKYLCVLYSDWLQISVLKTSYLFPLLVTQGPAVNVLPKQDACQFSELQ